MQSTLRQIPRSALAVRATRSAVVRSYATQPPYPTEDKANPDGHAKSSGSGGQIALIAALIAAGAGGYWYFSSDEHQAQAKRELHHLEDEAKHLKDRGVKALSDDRASLGDKIKDQYISEKNRAGSKADQALGPVVAKANEITEDAKEWLGAKTTPGDRLRGELEAAEAKAKATVDDVKKEGSSWFSWGSSKAEEAKDKADGKADQLAADARRKKDELAAEARQKGHEVKSEAKSFLNWGSSEAQKKTEEAKQTANNLSAQAQNELERAKASADKAARDASNYVEKTAEDVKKEANSWFSWGSQKANDTAHDAKESVKEGLLSVERATERGAQKAQHETKKL